jgi:hypothetical protein
MMQLLRAPMLLLRSPPHGQHDCAEPRAAPAAARPARPGLLLRLLGAPRKTLENPGLRTSPCLAEVLTLRLS